MPAIHREIVYYLIEQLQHKPAEILIIGNDKDSFLPIFPSQYKVEAIPTSAFREIKTDKQYDALLVNDALKDLNYRELELFIERILMTMKKDAVVEIHQDLSDSTLNLAHYTDFFDSVRFNDSKDKCVYGFKILWEQGLRDTIYPKAATVNVYEPIKLEDTNQKKVHLTVNGQGTVAANVEPFKSSVGLKFASIILGKNHHREKTLWLDVSNGDVTLCGKEAWRFKLVTLVDLNSLSLLYFPESSKYIWVSICKGRALIKFGHGYMLESNVLVRFEPKNPSERDRVSELIGSIEKIRLSDEWNLASPLKFWILPVVHDPNPMISEANDLGTVGINHNLPEEAIRLFARIRGAGVTLNDEQIAWINYSLATEGCKLHTILKQKEQSSNVSHKKNKGYLRFGIGINVGDSIHVPFVLELWPIGRESVIHSHGDEVAMIKLLHGCIEVSYYNPLANENNQELKPFKKAVLKKGDITWMTPEFYQTHKLENLSKDSVSISLQCYSYMGIDNVHYEHFDYINEIDHKLHKFNPTSDMPTLEDMLNMVQGEYMRAQAKGKIS